MFRKFFILISFIFYSSISISETLEIDMLNKLGKEKMVYSIKVAKVNLNDKIIWKSKTKGHNVEFLAGPSGWEIPKRSKMNKEYSYKFEIPGIYFYQCTPHKAMGMIGLVIVGNDKSNLEQIKKVKLRGKSKKVFKELLKEL